MSLAARYWAVIPAAGKGMRMGAPLPKQYLSLHDKPVIQHTIERLIAHPSITGVVVAVAPDDQWWPGIALPPGKPVHRVAGGAERFHSVFNALEFLRAHARHDDWVLVHDAARPCVRLADLSKLIAAVGDDDNGGLLGVPVADTLKRCDKNGVVEATIDRSALWRALTPQMFKLGLLRQALWQVMSMQQAVTDDAGAMELQGYHPRMVEGHGDNIKITRADDMQLAALYLQQQGA